MRIKKRFLLDHILISGSTVILINDYYKKLTSYTTKYYKLINKKGYSSREDAINIYKEQRKVFSIYNTGTAFFGAVKWLVYKNLLINKDNDKHYLIISNRRYDHPGFIDMQKIASKKLINLYNNFIFVK